MASLPPKGEELTLIRFLDALDSESESAKREIARPWEENIRQVQGDQWKIKRAPYFLVNIIKNQVKRKVSAVTEMKPQIRISAQKPELTKAASVLYNATRAIFDRNETDDVFYRMCLFAMTIGPGFISTMYDPIEDDIALSFIDPRRVQIDPGVTSGADLRHAQYIRIDTSTSLAEIRKRFPGRGALVQPDERLSSYVEKNKTSLISAALAMLPRPYHPGASRKSGPIPRAELRDYWINDPQINTEGDLLFPGGRHVTRVGNLILVDEANKNWDGEWPIDMFEWDVDFDHPWGIGEVQDLKRLQEAINRMGDSWIKNLLLGSNFRVIADADALDPDQWDKLDNDAGLIVRKKPNRQFEYQAPIPADPGTPTAIQSLMQLCDLLTGNMDPSGSRGESGPGAGLEGLQSSRQVLIRSVARRFESLLGRVGQKLISRIFQYYLSDRILFQQGPSHEWISYTFERQKLLQDDEGNARPVEERSRMYRDFKFLVTPGSSLASTRIQRVMAALQLRAATGVAPSVRRILGEADLGDPDELIQEGLEELSKLPTPPPPKGKSGRR